MIDLANGGSIDGIDRRRSTASSIWPCPSKMLEEGGTYVIPGHGRICDEPTSRCIATWS